MFADADGASKFSDLDKLEKEMSKTKNSDNMAVICGSRAHLEKDSIAKVLEYAAMYSNRKRLYMYFSTLLSLWSMIIKLFSKVKLRSH